MNRSARTLVTSACCMAAIAFSAGPAAAAARAYILVEVTGDNPDVRSAIEGAPFANCKLLTAAIWSNEIVGHLDCVDAASLNRAVTEQISGTEGVARVHVWLVRKSE